MNFLGLWCDRFEMSENVTPTPAQPTRVIDSDGSRMIVLGHCLAPDDALIECLRTVRTTRRLGPAAAKWPGCYSLVVVGSHELLLLTDPVGQFPLYTAATSAGIWVGSSAIGLASRVNAGIDRICLARSIACADVSDVCQNRSAFREIGRVPPGSVVTVRSGELSVSSREPLVVDPEMTFSAAVEPVRISLTRAIEARASRHLAGDLSGGIDSSALIFLGLRHGIGVSAFTFHHSTVEDDLTWARHFATLAPGLAHHLVEATDDELPYQHLVAASDHPHPSPFAVGPMRARLRLAAEQGASTYLVGEGGDVLFAVSPAYLADLARRGEMGALWRHCLRWGRIRQCSPLTLMRRAVAVGATSRRQALRSLAAAVERASPLAERPSWHLDAVSHWAAPRGDWLPRKARLALAEDIRAMADEPGEDHFGVADTVTASQLRTQVMTQRAVRDAGAEFGVEVHAPYLDTEVVRAALSLPAYRRVDTATPKPLLRSALTGIVPEVVVTRPTKGDYTRSAFLGVRRAAPALRTLLAESVAADHGLLDPVPVRAVLERAVHGLPTPWRELNQVFAVELWLRAVGRKVAGV